MNNKTNSSFYPGVDFRPLGKDQSYRIGKAVYEHYMSDYPAPDKVTVYKHALGLVSTGCYQASVKIETNFIQHSPKSHRVTFMFRLGKNGKIDTSTIQYL